jgi:hypothetical protein
VQYIVKQRVSSTGDAYAPLATTKGKEARSTAAVVESCDARALSATIEAHPTVTYKAARMGGTSKDELSPATEKGSTS